MRSYVGTLARILPRLALAVPLVVGGCSQASDVDQSSDGLTELGEQDALAELHQIGDTIRGLYGPLEYKRKRVGFDLDKELGKAEAAIHAGRTEGDRVRATMTLLAALDDAHVSYNFTARATTSRNFKLPLVLWPMEGKYAVAGVGPELGTGSGITKGDVLLSVDGISVADLEAALAPLDGKGNPETRRHFTARRLLTRTFAVPSNLVPTAEKAELVLERADGSRFTTSIFWRVDKGGVEGMFVPAPPAPPAATAIERLDRTLYSGGTAALLKENEASLPQLGAKLPFFLTDEVKTKLGLVDVAPKPETLTALGVAAADAAKVIFKAFKYTFEDHVVLLVRFPSYAPDDANLHVAWMAAILKDNMGAAGGAPAPSLADAPADVLVIDETHNPGGKVSLVTGLASLLTDRPIGNFVQMDHADRKWVSSFLDSANGTKASEEQLEWKSRAQRVEEAIDGSRPLSVAQPLEAPALGPSFVSEAAGRAVLNPHPAVQWRKPVLVLVDELSGSGGDFFAAFVKRDNLGTLFGNRTMGAGGSVEQVLTLPHSNATLNLTRGIAYIAHVDGSPPADDEIVENNGVIPDLPFAHTAADLRAGFVGYATAFSEAAVGLARK